MVDVCLCGFPPIEQKTLDGWGTRSFIPCGLAKTVETDIKRGFFSGAGEVAPDMESDYGCKAVSAATAAVKVMPGLIVASSPRVAKAGIIPTTGINM